MANTLTGLIPTIYNALDVVSRELVGMIPAVTMDATFERAAVGQTVKSPVAPASLATDITPAVTPPNDGDQNIGSVDMTITKSRRVPIRWNGEEKRGLDNNGASYNVILRDQFSQAMRTLTNEIESDLAGLYTRASRAHGTPGTALFGTNLADTAQVLKILKDNGAPNADMELVIDTMAGAQMRTLLQLTKANEANDDSLLRRGVLLDVHGFRIRESGQIKTHIAGTTTNATTNAAGYAVGSNVITLAAVAGGGSIVVGDVITFAGDSNKYLVAVGDADTTDGGTITLAEPGLRKAIPAAATAITVTAASSRSMAFHRGAIALATRAPALPEQGDSAVDRMLVTDPTSGITFEVSMYAQYRQMQYEVAIAWGQQVIAPRHVGLLIA